ncbi:aminomethyl-transferring glycine dehydrogenase subunit GcvPA [Natronococcus sp. JC468]|uniref:aminomethyl-transferring glycine dehydrogenase subunit GcvPA n=1 Tax=Natronococcus sp. JC468 TaxID=1961921 RepID=UPI00143BA491|nr:aminomethyl-transferring glycine dehydrogenase subunit GcvPA [Natronococcus sp. JC468]NKE36297.1 aminomethyl-transferring glycine dehydrogenase subunit GcvPA [Natronococcus sp. JC468]
MSYQNHLSRTDGTATESTGSPFAPHTEADVEAMLRAVDAESVAELFDVPSSVRFDGEFGIEAASEQEVVRSVVETLGRNESATEFLGRGRYDHYVPSLVDHLADRSEFLTSYTQYQPEITQGFLQALFEYQSLLVELTGLAVANCSMYDAATALGEVATLSRRARSVTGDRVLVPDALRDERRAVLENYVGGTALAVEEYPTADGVVEPDALEDALDDDVALVYVENPTTTGLIQDRLETVGELLADDDVLFCLGSDPIALSLLRTPAAVGADAVIGDASVLGLGTAYGTSLGLFACREEFLRQVPGRLVGASRDESGRRAYTLTLQTREQHIRRERATSNICTNQAWIALRTAIHAAVLGPEGLVDLAKKCHRLPEALSSELNEIEGVSAPVRNGYHFREFRATVEPDATELVSELYAEGFAVHAIDADTIQVCVTDANESRAAELVTAIEEVVA